MTASNIAIAAVIIASFAVVGCEGAAVGVQADARAALAPSTTIRSMLRRVTIVACSRSIPRLRYSLTTVMQHNEKSI